MADWNKIQAQLEKLIRDTNTITGKNDTNITDGIGELINGYGQSSGEAVDYPTAEGVEF